MSLNSIFSRPAEPYQRLPAVTVKVLDVKLDTKVTAWQYCGDGVKPLSTYNNTVAAITDGETIITFTLFENLASQIEKGKCYVIKDYIIGKYGKSMLNTRKTAIYYCSPINVPGHFEAEGAKLLTPPSQLTTISELPPPATEYITIEGFISTLRPVQRYHGGKGPAVPMTTISVKQEKAEVKMVLWREANMTELVAGMPVRVSHLKARNSAAEEISLHSTNFTKVEVLPGHVELHIRGIRKLAGGDIEILDMEDSVHVVPREMWYKTFPEEGVLPEKVTVHYNNGGVWQVCLKEDEE